MPRVTTRPGHPYPLGATWSGVIAPRLEDDGEVRVDMGTPRFAAADVPFVGGTGAAVETIDVDGRSVSVSVLSMGNPHAVQVVETIDTAPVRTQGPLIEHHARFPQRVTSSTR